MTIPPRPSLSSCQVGRSSLLVGNLKKKYAQGLLAEKPQQQDNTTTTDSEMEEPYLQGTTGGLVGVVLRCQDAGVGILPFSKKAGREWLAAWVFPSLASEGCQPIRV